jgi:hypothetical protein
VNAAKAAKADKDQRLIFVSVRLPSLVHMPTMRRWADLGSIFILSSSPQASMANPKSSILYSRTKGLTEQALAELGYKDTIIFRPGALSNTQRSDSRLAESAFLYALPFFFFCFPIVCGRGRPRKLIIE